MGLSFPACDECLLVVVDAQKDVCCLQGQVRLLLLPSSCLLGMDRSGRNL